MASDEEPLQIDFFLGDTFRLLEIESKLPADISKSEVESALACELPPIPYHSARKQLDDDRDERQEVAVENLSKKLLKHSEKLKAARKKNDVAAPVRSAGLMPNSSISFLAWEMLASYQFKGPPPYWLLRLIRTQLDVPDRRSISEERKRRNAFNQACLAIYRNPEWSLRKVASEVGVDVSTISRWGRPLLAERGHDLIARRERAFRMIRRAAEQAKADTEYFIAAGFPPEEAKNMRRIRDPEEE